MNPQRRRWLIQLAQMAPMAQMPRAVRMPLLAAASAVGASSAQGAAGGPAAGATGAIDAGAGPAAAADAVRRGRPIGFPRDHGAHLGQRIEWWYATGWLSSKGEVAGGPTGKTANGSTAEGQPEKDEKTSVETAGLLGFQLTFFRSRTGLAGSLPGRFAPRQLLFAHAAVTDLDGRRHLHDQRLVRWSEAADAALGRAALADGDVHIGDWSFRREGPWPQSRWLARLPARDFGITLTLTETQPPLLQGDAGFSRKGPQEQQASHYYSLPQMQAAGQVTLGKQVRTLTGRAWLDHEWSDQILHPQAAGWDWIGMNLFDGSALTAFVLRRADGSALWAGGSFRSGPVGPAGTAEAAGQARYRRSDVHAPGSKPPAAGAAASRSFGPLEVRWQPGRVWRSPATAASYPVAWRVQTPVGNFEVRALADAQELDSRSSTGSVYWEGLSELLDAGGHRVGLGYLEMTGYAGALRMA